MTPLELLTLIRSCDQQVASLFAEMITINFAMIVAIYYFLSRTQIGMKFAAFVFYAVGMLAIFGMMLREANIKQVALTQIDLMTPEARGPVVEGYHQLSHSWLFLDTGYFINGAHWLLWLSVIYLLFFWRKPV